MHISKKFRIATAVMVGGIVVASSACSTDALDQATGPRAMAPVLTANHAALRSSTSTGSGAAFPDMSKDGTYYVNVDPNVANTLVMGVNKLDIPAASVCGTRCSGAKPGSSWRVSGCPVSTSIAASCWTSSAQTSDTASPEAPARPVRPVRWT